MVWPSSTFTQRTMYDYAELLAHMTGGRSLKGAAYLAVNLQSLNTGHVALCLMD